MNGGTIEVWQSYSKVPRVKGYSICIAVRVDVLFQIEGVSMLEWGSMSSQSSLQRFSSDKYPIYHLNTS